MGERLRRCPCCGEDLPANAPDGICPRCLLRNALEGDGTETFSHGMSVSSEPGELAVWRRWPSRSGAFRNPPARS